MSEKPYIAVAVAEDGETLFSDHFGHAPRFQIYDRERKLIETRDNPFADQEHDHDHHHGHGHGHHHHGGGHAGPKRIVDLLPECGVFIARAMGNGQRVLPGRFGVQPILTDEITVEGALTRHIP
jgi:hypothetical protein